MKVSIGSVPIADIFNLALFLDLLKIEQPINLTFVSVSANCIIEGLNLLKLIILHQKPFLPP